MGKISGERDGHGREKGRVISKSRKGFGHDVRGANAGPSNTTARDLLGNEVPPGVVCLLEGY